MARVTMPASMGSSSTMPRVDRVLIRSPREDPHEVVFEG